ncbi:MAG: class I SAM-dependent methyltransferase [Gemmataceae bacterium]
MTADAKPPRPDYGLDAPGVVRNLFLVGAAGLALRLSAAVGLWSGVVAHVDLAGTGIGFFVTFTLTALYMVWSSRVGKIKDREQLLDHVAWRGDEQVLDVGCGRGLLLIGAAKRLTTGRATGIDIWQTEDLSGNCMEATLENARREGVADRVEVKTADMRQMPFADGTFDAVVSSWAVHNLYDPKDRDRAVAEIARVLKPGGTAVIKDIRHIGQYAAALTANGCPDVRRVDSRAASLFTTVLTFGSLRPGVLVACKDD